MAQKVKNPPAMWENGYNPWVGKIPWRRERLPTPLFWPGEFLGLYNPWDFPGKNTGVGCHALLQGIFPTHGSNPGLLLGRGILPTWEAEATIRTGHGTTDWFQIGKGVCQGCILSPSLFNFYAEYIMRNTGLEETQAGIKIAGRNINNLKYADDTTLMAESEEELKSLLMKVKVESEKVGLNLNIQKTKIMASGPITPWEIDGETVESVRLYFGGLQNHCRW